MVLIIIVKSAVIPKYSFKRVTLKMEIMLYLTPFQAK